MAVDSTVTPCKQLPELIYHRRTKHMKGRPKFKEIMSRHSLDQNLGSPAPNLTIISTCQELVSSVTLHPCGSGGDHGLIARELPNLCSLAELLRTVAGFED